jgi:hypothetical protein
LVTFGVAVWQRAYIVDFLGTWVKPPPKRDPRNPYEFVHDFLALKREGKHAEADAMLLPGRLSPDNSAAMAEIPPDDKIRFKSSPLLDSTALQTVWRVRAPDEEPPGTLIGFTWHVNYVPEGPRITSVRKMRPEEFDIFDQIVE